MSMTAIIFASLLIAVSIAAATIKKTYFAWPLKELQRQARRGDAFAETIYSLVAYDRTLRASLWLVIAGSATAGIVVLGQATSPLLAALALFAELYILFSWLPVSRMTAFSRRLTIAVTPLLLWLVSHAHPVVGRAAAYVDRSRRVRAHTGLYERKDLLDMIEQQQSQPDNRLSIEELEIIKRAVRFDEYTVADVLIPRKQVPVIAPTETLGPIVIDELHASKQDYALVKASPKEPFLGSLRLKQLGIKASGTVADAMDDCVYYMHENDSLAEALHVFFETNHGLFVVVNSHQEYLGIITIETVLRQLVGHVPGDSFDTYTDIAAVAGKHKAGLATEPSKND